MRGISLKAGNFNHTGGKFTEVTPRCTRHQCCPVGGSSRNKSRQWELSNWVWNLVINWFSESHTSSRDLWVGAVGNMRSRTKWRGVSGKDRLKEASRKLKTILKNCKKLNVSSEDLGSLKGTHRLQDVCNGDRETDNWLFYGTVGSGLLIVLLIVAVVSAALQDTLCTPNNTTKVSTRKIL